MKIKYLIRRFKYKLSTVKLPNINIKFNIIRRFFKKINLYKISFGKIKLSKLNFFSKIRFFAIVSSYFKNLLNKFFVKLNFGTQTQLSNGYKNNKIIKLPREYYLIFFFGFVFFVVFARLFYLQVVQADYYHKLLVGQHFTQSLLKAKRGDIYLTDKAGKNIKLTESIDIYTMYLDPKFIMDKKRVIEVLSPTIYKHFCEIYGLEKPTKLECIHNLEKFSGKSILRQKSEYAVGTGLQTGTGEEIEQQSNITIGDVTIDLTSYDKENEEIVSNFLSGDGIKVIAEKLEQLIIGGVRPSNYFGFFDNDQLLDELKNLSLDYVSINSNYVYFIPGKVVDIDAGINKLISVFSKYGYVYDYNDFKSALFPKEIRYVRIVSNLNSQIAKDIKDLKKKYYEDKIDKIPLLHGIGLEKSEERYYPYGDFLSHVLGYTDENGSAFYGIEKFFNHLLKGKDGKMVGLSVPWIGAIGSNSFDIDDPVDGNDVYLTIDMNLQKQVEKLLKFYYSDLKPDSISLLLMDPYSGKVKAMANYPNFDPNNFKEIYKIKPLKGEDNKIADDDSYIDMPVLLFTGDKLKVATYNERKNPNISKFIFKNYLGPSVFVDKNIGFPYEPGSIFKTVTLGIGVDSDEISIYDLYQDTMSIQVGPYTISNVHEQCKGTHSFLHSLEWSCNVGMAKIGMKIKKWLYYNYLDRLGFGKPTGIELDGEDPGKVSGHEDFSLARFYNNTFGQGILTTPVQLASSYSALVNGGYLVQPTVIDKIYDKKTGNYITFDKKIKKRVFKEETSEKIKEALFKVVSEGDLIGLDITGFTLGGKTGTSQIAFKGGYRGGNGWTNSSFVGIVTKNDLRYVVVVQVRRPRSCQWGLCTAGFIFKDLSKSLIEMDGIKG